MPQRNAGTSEGWVVPRFRPPPKGAIGAIAQLAMSDLLGRATVRTQSATSPCQSVGRQPSQPKPRQQIEPVSRVSVSHLDLGSGARPGRIAVDLLVYLLARIAFSWAAEGFLPRATVSTTQSLATRCACPSVPDCAADCNPSGSVSCHS